MKKLTTIITVAVLAIAFLGSCKKESNDPPTQPTPSTFLTCKIDGSNWNATAVIGQSVGSITNISGSTLTGSSISIILENPIQVGTYYAGPATMNTLTYIKGFASSPFTTFTSGSGIVNITAYSLKSVEGTFQFTGVDSNGNSKVISSGSFKSNIN